MEIDWVQVLEEVSKQIPPIYYGSFITPLLFENINEQRLLLRAPSPIIKNHVEKKYQKFFQDAIHKLSGNLVQIEILVDSETEVPITEFVTEKFNEEFNPDYNLTNYVIGTSNCLAFTACQEVLENPGKFNPLYIYGSVGVGKTHLLQAIGAGLQKKYPDSKVKYTSITRFLSEFVYTIQNKQPVEVFRNKYYSYNTLIIDDIQLLNSSAEKTQDEFYALFNYMYERKRQIIIAADRPILDLPLYDRLKSRFSTGNQVLIKSPDEEVRLKILDAKLKELQLTLSVNSRNFLCENFKSDTRNLIGALNELALYKKTFNLLLLTEDKIQEILHNRMDKQTRNEITHDRILDTVCAYYSQEKKDVISKSRRAEYIIPRHIAMFLLHEVAKMNKSSIGKLFSTNHTTVISAVKKVEKRIKEDLGFKRIVDGFRSKFEFR